MISIEGIGAGVHRLWSHRAYKARLPLRIFLIIANTMAFQVRSSAVLSCVSALWMTQGRVADIRTQKGSLQWSSQVHAQYRDPHNMGHLLVTGKGNRTLVEQVLQP